MKEKLKDHFKRYKNADVAYVAGGTIFLTEQAALSYGKGEVHKVTRSEVEKDEPKGNAEGEPEPLTKEQIQNMSYNDLKAAVKARKIVVEKNDAETLRAALLAQTEGKEE